MTIEKLKPYGVMLVVALLAIFAYDVVIVQPQIRDMSGGAPIEVGTQSVTRFNRPIQFQDILTMEQPVTMDSTLSVAGASTLTGAVTTSGDLSAVNISGSGSITATGDMKTTGLTVTGDESVVNLAASGSITATGDMSTTAITVNGAATLSASSIDSTEIANITRTVSIPLISFMECTTDAGANIDFSDDADAFPDFTGLATDGLGFFLEFDSTGSSEDTARACDNLTVPEDYASNGLFELVVAKDAETGANTEVINCAGSINGAALGAGGTVTVSGTALVAYSCEPTLTSLAAGDSLGFTIYVTSGGTVDDDTQIYSVGFQYTATQ